MTPWDMMLSNECIYQVLVFFPPRLQVRMMVMAARPSSTSCVVYLIWWSSWISMFAQYMSCTITCHTHMTGVSWDVCGEMFVEITCKCVCVVPYTLCCSYPCACHGFWTWLSCSNSAILVHHACCKTTYTSHWCVNNGQCNIIVFQSLCISLWTICKSVASYLPSRSVLI